MAQAGFKTDFKHGPNDILKMAKTGFNKYLNNDPNDIFEMAKAGFKIILKIGCLVGICSVLALPKGHFLNNFESRFGYFKNVVWANFLNYFKSRFGHF